MQAVKSQCGYLERVSTSLKEKKMLSILLAHQESKESLSQGDLGALPNGLAWTLENSKSGKLSIGIFFFVST